MPEKEIRAAENQQNQRTDEPERLWPGGPLFLADPHMPLTTDAILLADFSSVRAGERGADLGCGSGILMLLLMEREERLRMTGLELREEAVALAKENLRLNAMDGRGEILSGDLRETARLLPNGGFDFVISNPPYYAAGNGAEAKNADRAAARSGYGLSLPELCRAASRLCRGGGRCFFSCRPERLSELLREMSEAHLEPKRLRFVHHNTESVASLVLAEGRKDGKPGLTTERPFLIRNRNGEESAEYRRICHLPETRE